MGSVISEKMNKIEKGLDILSQNSEKLEGKIDELSSLVDSNSFSSNIHIYK